jgi:2-phosphosulfolactate phosphatase
VHAARDADAVFMGCLRNRAAAARAAAAAASELGRGLTVICAGREGRFSLDDAYTAGAIVDAIAGTGHVLIHTDAAVAAQTLYRSAPDPMALFRRSRAGRHVIEIGLADDLLYCAEADRSELVPRVGERVRVVAE